MPGVPEIAIANRSPPTGQTGRSDGARRCASLSRDSLVWCFRTRPYNPIQKDRTQPLRKEFDSRQCTWMVTQPMTLWLRRPTRNPSRSPDWPHLVDRPTEEAVSPGPWPTTRCRHRRTDSTSAEVARPHRSAGRYRLAPHCLVPTGRLTKTEPTIGPMSQRAKTFGARCRHPD
jgi:hypothetical protein